MLEEKILYGGFHNFPDKHVFLQVLILPLYEAIKIVQFT
jgi:hypothetical protein